MPFSQSAAELPANLFNGPGWFFYAPLTVTVPAKLDDIIALATPYAPKTGWISGGMVTRDAMSVAMSMTATDFMTGHSNLPVGRRVTDTSRLATVDLQELTPALTQLIENTPTPTTVAAGIAGSGTSAQTIIPVGSIQTLTRYRCAFVGERDPALTGVTGEGGARGLLFAYILYQASVSGKESTFSMDPDTLSSRAVELEAFPEPTIADVRQQHGFIALETGVTVP
jgi:hypothetical protein